MPAANAGWYPDPENPGYVAYFDGQAWVYDAEPSTPLKKPAPDQPIAPFPTFAAGWYPDPTSPGHIAYFDGNGWRNPEPQPPQSPGFADEPKPTAPLASPAPEQTTTLGSSFCGQCGAVAEQDYRFCFACGHELDLRTNDDPAKDAKT